MSFLTYLKELAVASSITEAVNVLIHLSFTHHSQWDFCTDFNKSKEERGRTFYATSERNIKPNCHHLETKSIFVIISILCIGCVVVCCYKLPDLGAIRTATSDIWCNFEDFFCWIFRKIIIVWDSFVVPYFSCSPQRLVDADIYELCMYMYVWHCE